MARDFDGTDDNLSVNTAAVTAAPLTVACWFNADTTAADMWLVNLCVSTENNNNQFSLLASGGTAGDPVEWLARDGVSSAIASTGSGYSTGVWHHACGIEYASNSRAAFIDGGSKGTNTTSKTPSGINRTAIGRQQDSAPSGPFNGRIAEVAIWDVDLTDAEVASLADGLCPLFVRPGRLVAYWPLLGRFDPEISVRGGFDLTVTGALVGDHPRILYPAPPLLGQGAAPAAPAGRTVRRPLVIGPFLHPALWE